MKPITIVKGQGLHGVNFWVRLFGPGSEGLAESDVQWFSSIDGFLGRGRFFDTSKLSLGDHNISVQVEGENGLVSTSIVKNIKVVDSPPELSVLVGDGSGELGCNEVKLDVVEKEVDIEYASYGFNLTKQQLPIHVSDLTSFPLTYRFSKETSIYFYAIDVLGQTSTYRKTLKPIECEKQKDQIK